MGTSETGRGDPAISVAGLAKRYGKAAALTDVSFQAAAGTVTALLGPNGAGKARYQIVTFICRD